MLCIRLVYIVILPHKVTPLHLLIVLISLESLLIAYANKSTLGLSTLSA